MAEMCTCWFRLCRGWQRRLSGSASDTGLLLHVLAAWPTRARPLHVPMLSMFHHVCPATDGLPLSGKCTAASLLAQRCCGCRAAARTVAGIRAAARFARRAAQVHAVYEPAIQRAVAPWRLPAVGELAPALACTAIPRPVPGRTPCTTNPTAMALPKALCLHLALQFKPLERSP